MKKYYLFLILIIATPFLSNAQWQVQSSAFSDSLRGLEQISSVNNEIAWAIAFDGSANDSIVQEFTRTIDGGATWIAGAINGASGLIPTGIFALNADTAWVLCYNPTTDGGKVFRTNDAGISWAHQSTALFTDTLEAYPNLIYFWNENEGFCSGDPTNGYFEVYTTQNGGALWTRVSSSNLPSLISGEWGYSGHLSVVDNHAWFGTCKGNIYHSNDKGNTWSAISSPLLNTGKVRVIQFKDSLTGIIGDRSGNTFNLYKTSNGGTTWQSISPTGPVYGRSLAYVKGTTGTLVTTSNASAFSGSSISYDFGNTWTLIPGSSGMAFTCLSDFHNQTAWAGLLNQSSTVGGVAKLKILSDDAGVTQLLNPSNTSSCVGSEDIILRIKNFGQGLLESITIQWSMGGIPQTPMTPILNLGAGQSIDINMGSYNYSTDGTIILIANTSLPNGMPDSYLINDTLSFLIMVYPLPILSLGSDTILQSNQSILLNAGTIYYSYLWSTGDTNQTLLVNIANSGLGQSDYWVKVLDGHGCIGMDTISIMFVTGIENTMMENHINIYPNPNNGNFYIKNTNNLNIYSVSIYDNLGRLIYHDQKQNNLNISMQNPVNGMYFIKLETSKGIVWTKIMVDNN